MAKAPSRSAREVVPLTGIRGLAALIVLLAHAELWSRSGTHTFPAQIAVDLFFVLSGFVISFTYLGDGSRGFADWKGFALARFARIYPLHLATVTALGLVGATLALRAGQSLPNHTFSIGQLVQQLLLTSVLPVVGSNVAWNHPAWSVAIEWWVYITLFPVLALFAWRLSTRGAALLGMLVTVTLAVWLTIDPDHVTRGWLGLARGMSGFLAGWAAWRVSIAPTRWTPPSWTTGALGLAVLGVAFVWAQLFRQPPWLCLPLLPLLIYGLVVSPGGTGRLLSLPPLIWLGDISYGAYMLHVPVLMVMEKVGGVGPALGGPVVWITVCLGISLLLGQLSLTLFERPAQHWIRSLRRKPAA